MTVRELLSRMDARELSEWQAYFRLEDKEDKRRDLDRGAAAGVNAMKARRR